MFGVMAGYQQHHDFLKNEQPSQAGEENPAGLKEEHVVQDDNYYQTAPFPGFNHDYTQFTQLPISYDNLGFMDMPANFGYTIPSQNFDNTPIPQHFNDQPLNIDAANTFFDTYNEQPWADEINASYTQIANQPYGWPNLNTNPYGWPIGAPSVEYGQQAVYGNMPIHTQISQRPFMENIVSENTVSENTVSGPLVTHRYVSDMLPHNASKSSFIPQSSSTALRIRNDRFKKEPMSTQLTRQDAGEHRPMRVTKMKRKENADSGGKHEACWRCKRYRKACIGLDVCKECSTAGFRVWPSAIGCRRGAMEGFVEKIMPAHSISVLRDLQSGVSRTSNWRKALIPANSASMSQAGTNDLDRWNLVKSKVQSTMVFGEDFSTLVDVLVEYERSQKTEVAVWTQSIIVLSSMCDIYHFFVASSSIEVQLPNLINSTIKFRKALIRSYEMFLKFSLSGRRENWFPAFMAVVLGITSLVILVDTLASVPDETRRAIWGDIEVLIKDLRIRQYMMTLDLLRIGAKGINPLKLDYWTFEEELNEAGEKVKIRNEKGMALLSHDIHAFDGFVALKQWHTRYKSVLQRGHELFNAPAYTYANLQAVAALSRVFDF